MSSAAVMVYVPVSREQAEVLAAGEVALDADGFAATAGLREAHGFEAADDEDADFTALGYAGLGALLLAPGPRLVLAADVDATQVVEDADSPFGAVGVRRLRWAQVQALFADEPGAADDLVRAHELATGRTLALVAEDEQVLELADAWDLLWYAPQELAALG